MKPNIHPNWNDQTKVVCACGNTFNTGSTLSEIRVELCSKCHPLFTGTSKLVDTLGQVERFQKKTESSKAKQEERKRILETRKLKVDEKSKDRPSLKEMLLRARKQVSS